MDKASGIKCWIFSFLKSVSVVCGRRVACFSIAFRQGVLLLPLPFYWDALSCIDWRVLCMDDELLLAQIREEALKYFPLMEMAHCSGVHEALLEQFLEHGYGGFRPPRPKWLY